MRRIAWIGAVFLAAVAAAGLRGQTMPAARQDNAQRVRKIATELGAAGDRESAVANMRQLLAADPRSAVTHFRTGWLKNLLENKRFEDCDALAVQAILAAPDDLTSVEYCQQIRVRALLGAGKMEEALGASRALFNVASMAGTSNALLLVAECLNAANPDDPTIVSRFRREQTLAGTPPPVQVETAPTRPPEAPRGVILLGIKMEGGGAGAVFEDAAKHVYAEDYVSLTGKGNLLLLANKPADARTVFERAYAVATQGSLVPATESLARVMKAEDGAIGRANAWVLSLRPAAQRGR